MDQSTESTIVSTPTSVEPTLASMPTSVKSTLVSMPTSVESTPVSMPTSVEPTSAPILAPTTDEIFRHTVVNAYTAPITENSNSPDKIKFYTPSEFDKNVLQKDFMKLFDRYIAKGFLFDKINNAITIIYIDTAATMYSIKYYDSYVERYKHTLLKEIVELNAGVYQPNYRLIIDMLKQFTIYFDAIVNFGLVENKSHFNEYSVGDLYRHIPYFNKTNINNLISTNITNPHVLDNTLLRVYDLFRVHNNQKCNKDIIRLTEEHNKYKQLFKSEMIEHQKTRNQNKECVAKLENHERKNYEYLYDLRVVSEKLLTSERSYMFTKSSIEEFQNREKILLSKVQDLTTENEQLRQTVSRLQTHVIAAINTLDSFQSTTDKK